MLADQRFLVHYPEKLNDELVTHFFSCSQDVIVRRKISGVPKHRTLDIVVMLSEFEPGMILVSSPET